MQASGRAEWCKQQANWETGTCGSYLKISKLFGENRSYECNKKVLHGLIVGYMPYSWAELTDFKGHRACWYSKSNKIHPLLCYSPITPLPQGLLMDTLKQNSLLFNWMNIKNENKTQ